MADVDADEHCAHLAHLGRELECVQVATHFGVHLAQDIAGLRQIESVSVLASDDLTGHAELLHQLFVGRVVVLIPQKNDDDLRVSELLEFSHVHGQLVLHCLEIVLFISLDPVGVLNLDVELLRTLLEVTHHLICLIVELLIVDEDPLFFKEVDCLLDGQLAQLRLTAGDNLVTFDQLRLRQNIGLHLNRLGFNAEAPLLDGLLPEEFSDHLLDLFHLLLGLDSSLSHGIAHLF